MTHSSLFVYGTLRDPDVLGAVLGRVVDTGAMRAATAAGYRAVAYPGRVYPALVEATGDAAPGLLLDDLSDLDFAVLDAFEGDEYRRRTITVQLDEGPVAAQAYIPVVPIEAGLPEWSLSEWAAAHKPRVIGQETGTAAALRERLSAQVPE